MNTTACTPENTYDDTRKPLIVAHRGGASLGMENSLSCIGKGIEAGADMVEVDVHLTADGEVVVCHDASVNRTTNGRGRIAKMTLAEVRALRLLRADGSPSDEPVPTLQEVLQLVKGRCGLLLEIKKRRGQYEGIEKKVADLLVQNGMVEQVAVQSFNVPVLEEMHRLLPQLRLEMLCFTAPLHIECYDYVSSFNIWYLFASRRFVNRAHAAGREVKIWTVNRRGRASRLPVDGIITNKPQLFR